MTLNERVVMAARGWVGTRFHHQGRLKKTATHRGGVDCLGLLIGVANEIGLMRVGGMPLVAMDETDYPHYPDTEHLRKKLSQAMEEIPIGSMQAGDIILLSINKQPQHLAIVSELPWGFSMIHAYAPARAVVEHVLDNSWKERIAAAYRIINPIQS